MNQIMIKIFLLIFLQFSVIYANKYTFVKNFTVDNTNISTSFWNCKENGPSKTAKLSYAIYLDAEWKPTNVIIPNDINIVLGKNAIISADIVEPLNQQCSLSDLPGSVYSWHDPENWKVLINPESNFLHAQLIPSDIDMAIFGNESTYNVTINYPIKIGSISYDGQEVDGDEFLKFVKSPEGMTQFHFGPSIDEIQLKTDSRFETEVLKFFGGSTCDEFGGCVNSNVNKQVMEEICSNIKCPTEFSCQDWFKPIGHCCNICGAKITVKTVETVFQETQMTSSLMVVKKRPIKSHMSVMKIDQNTYQIILIPPRDDFLSIKKQSYDINEIKPDLDLMMQILKKNSKLIGIDPERIVSNASRNLEVLGTGISILLIIIILLLIIGLTMVGYKKREVIKEKFMTKRINFVAFWGTDRAEGANRDDRILLELADEVATSTSGSSSLKKSPWVSNQSSKQLKVSSLIPTAFKALMQREKAEVQEVQKTTSSTSTKSKKMNNGDDDNPMTFSNPVYEKSYSMNFEE